MPRKASPRAASPKRRGGTLLGVLVGILIGVLVAAGVAWYVNRTPVPFIDKKPESAAKTPRAGSEPAPLPGKPGDKPLEKPRFDFYKVLPEGADNATLPTAPAAAPAEAAASKPAAEKVFLQVGSFQKPSDADNLKAKLALMGLEASVRQAEVPEKGVVHRVLVGPYATPEEFNAARNQLGQAGIPSSVVRTKN
ncbi:MAG: hypothetical protein RIR70_241 [Pseudomonadota bacterium]|jgi:cell division protein FtsN